MRTRLIIADDHPIVLAGIRGALREETGVDVLGEADSPEQLLDLLARHTPDIVVTDYSMPSSGETPDGCALVAMIHRRHPSVRIVVLTMIENPPLIAQMYAAGASAVVAKSGGLGELVNSLRRVIANRPLPASAQQQNRSSDNGAHALSPREIEVVRLFASGMSVGMIAAHLHRSNKTVSTQKVSAMRKLGLGSDPELIAYCLQHGLMS